MLKRNRGLTGCHVSLGLPAKHTVPTSPKFIRRFSTRFLVLKGNILPTIGAVRNTDCVYEEKLNEKKKIRSALGDMSYKETCLKQ